MAHGIKTTAGVVTAAAMVMVFVFLTFATMSMVQLKEMGVGLAVAVLLDATIVRALLLPATMKLLGRRNWYLPRWLGGCRGPLGPSLSLSRPARQQPPVTVVGPWRQREETVVMDTVRFAVGAAVHAPRVAVRSGSNPSLATERHGLRAVLLIPRPAWFPSHSPVLLLRLEPVLLSHQEALRLCDHVETVLAQRRAIPLAARPVSVACPCILVSKAAARTG